MSESQEESQVKIAVTLEQDKDGYPPFLPLEELKQELHLGYARVRWDFEEACLAQPAEEAQA